MDSSIPSNEYNSLIKKIRRKRRWTIGLTIAAELITVTACSPLCIEVLDKTLLDYKGIHPAVTVVLVLFLFLCGLIAYAVVSSPLAASMDVECDPQKHLILNSFFYKKQDITVIYATDLFYMGRFSDALGYANQMLTSKKKLSVPVGLFHKARCEFFLGDFDSLRLTVQQHATVVSGGKKERAATQAVLDKHQTCLALMLAIADGDRERMDAGRRAVEPWNNAPATWGYIDYLKGVAAYFVGDKEESIYRLMAVKEHCGKTVLAQLADQYLVRLK